MTCSKCHGTRWKDASDPTGKAVICMNCGTYVSQYVKPTTNEKDRAGTPFHCKAYRIYIPCPIEGCDGQFEKGRPVIPICKGCNDKIRSWIRKGKKSLSKVSGTPCPIVEIAGVWQKNPLIMADEKWSRPGRKAKI